MRDTAANQSERHVLVLQGGGALGAYQAGAYEALTSYDKTPGWLAGISIGAINAAIIAGNLPGHAGRKAPAVLGARLLGISRRPHPTRWQGTDTVQ